MINLHERMLLTSEGVEPTTFWFFRDQTVLNDQNAVLPNIIPYNVTLETVTLTSLEVESVLKTLVLGKASGPNGLNNIILKELAHEISAALCALFI